MGIYLDCVDTIDFFYVCKKEALYELLWWDKELNKLIDWKEIMAVDFVKYLIEI